MATRRPPSLAIALATASIVAGTTLGLSSAQAGGYGGPYGFGTPASAAEIAAVDIDVMPDGRGLPPGSGTAETGKRIYMEKCAACHGDKMQGNGAVGGAALIGGRGSLSADKQKLTIESYWPYATTVFDYVKRAMPFNAPGSLSDDQVYAVTAFILAEANIVQQSAGMDASILPAVRMPNRDGFVSDPRPDVFNYD